jgi:hypothetical protein
VVAVLVALAVTLMIASNVIIAAMVGEVNRKLPEDQQISSGWRYPGKFSEISDQYKRFYPNGPLARVLKVIGVLIVIMMAAAAYLFGVRSGNL